MEKRVFHNYTKSYQFKKENMKLEGKFKEDFEKWFESQIFIDQEIDDESGNNLSVLNVPAFYSLTDAMQWGVFQDFENSILDPSDLRILPKVSPGYNCFFIEMRGVMKKYETRAEARTEAIETFQEIYNQGR